jgi:hypothetical protein
VARSRGIEIVRRAYELWEQAGKPDGQDQEFYHQAERELTEAAALAPTFRSPRRNEPAGRIFKAQERESGLPVTAVAANSLRTAAAALPTFSTAF